MNRYSYNMYEMAHLALSPARAISDATRLAFKNPLNPMTHTLMGRNLAAASELFERITRRYGKPIFGLDSTMVNGTLAQVHEQIVWERPFCKLIHFQREFHGTPPAVQPKLLIVAPMSGHYATLLRGTVETFLPTHEVYITDWSDARQVPLALGHFDLEDYIDILIDMCRFLHADGSKIHTLGVCQPSVPLIAAVARMDEAKDPAAPASMTLMGGPIDTRKSPTAVNCMAQERGPDWFRQNCIHTVPFPYPGVGRKVYPGFQQLSGFMAMNMDRHVNAHVDMFKHLVKNDGDSAEKHRDFYDEYMAVMDLTAEFYLQTVDAVFVKHSLPKGELMHRGSRIDLSTIHTTGLMTVEGENDDISGIGQTYAAQELCVNIPENRKVHYMQKDVGHYGVFNGSRFRREIAPRICAFHAAIDGMATKTAAKTSLKAPASKKAVSKSPAKVR